MGIVNVTPDSFFDGGKYDSTETAVEQGLRLASEGAHILDVGGESTRPGSGEVSYEEEIARVVPVLKELHRRAGVPLSIDTRKSAVAAAGVSAGARVINDVTALTHDPDLARVAASNDTGLVLSHIRGTPKTMQSQPHYDNVLQDVRDDLARSLDLALRAGVSEAGIAIDPGIGFGKTLKHNLILIRHLFELRSLGFPILLGPSRKSFLGSLLDLPVEKRLEGTIAVCTWAVHEGADLLRIHDVKEVGRAVRVAEAIAAEGV